MSLDIYLRLRAAAQHRAVPRASFRHVHLHQRPFVVAGYHLAGELGAPVALLYGTDRDDPRIMAVGEPRDRRQRFAALTEFSRDLAAYLDGFHDRQAVERADGPVELCSDAPQLVVPNAATAGWVADLLGRSLRFLRTDGEHPVDPVLPAAGAHLTWFATRRVIPGSSTVLAATDALTSHWTTGQLPAEDANLATVLAWIDPPPADTPAGGVPSRTDGDATAAAFAAEQLPPAGPVSDPAWDRDRLSDAIGDPVAVRDVCEAALRPAWEHTWTARDLLGFLPEAAHAPARWETDRWAWTRHLDRVTAGTAHFSRTMAGLQSFRLVAELEKRTGALERQMALDDPLVMAGHVASGEALAGVVTGRDVEHRIPLASGRSGLRPLLRLRPIVPFERPLGTELGWAANPRVTVTVTGFDGDEVTLRVDRGACRSPDSAATILPEPGTRMILATFAADDAYPDNLPENLPWTHQPPDDPPLVPDPRSPETSP